MEIMHLVLAIFFTALAGFRLGALAERRYGRRFVSTGRGTCRIVLPANPSGGSFRVHGPAEVEAPHEWWLLCGDQWAYFQAVTLADGHREWRKGEEGRGPP